MAISTREFHVEVPCNPFGDTVVELHLFRRMPVFDALPELLRKGVERDGKGIRGISPYGDARGMSLRSLEPVAAGWGKVLHLPVDGQVSC